MAELTFRSPGISAREIDLTGPTNVTPSGVPAGIIGTANQGPAFVPVTLGSQQDFVTKFGETDGEKFGPLAVIEWLSNAQSVTYMRVLGAGDGKKRTTTGDNPGKVTNAGFVVGAEQVQGAGLVSRNTKAVDSGPAGRLHFLGCFMSESAGSTIFSSAGIQRSGENLAHPILRGVLLAASGVVPMLSASFAASSTKPSSTVAATAAGPQGAITGSVDLTGAQQDFVLLLNGHVDTAQYPNLITASFDVDAPNYFGNVLNTDPLRVEDAGHLLYARYDIHPAFATVTGSGIIAPATETPDNKEPVAFLLTSSLARNAGSTTIPNFENFEDRFRTPETPYVISQKFGGNPVNLFKVYALSDGAFANTKFKISIRNIAKSNSLTDKYGTFDLLVREYGDTDDNPAVLEQFTNLSLNPSSDRYIAKIIGDQHVYWDFDKNDDSQRLVFDGNFPNLSNLIRVEMTTTVDDAEVDSTSLPVGFRGPRHLVTSGSSIMVTPPTAGGGFNANQHLSYRRLVEPPVPFRESVKTGVTPKDDVNTSFYWGVQFVRKTKLDEPNLSLVADKTIDGFAKYFPRFHTTNQNPSVGDNAGTADSAGTVYDSDRFNNNIFTLENVKVRTGSNGIADPKEWVSASYVRQGGISADAAAKTRALSVATDFGDATVKTYAKFSFFVQGGFDGVNIFDSNKAKLLNTAIVREMTDAAQGQNDGPTVSAYTKALDIMQETSEVDIKLLAVPGIRHSIVTDKGVSVVENRFDALFIMDVEERDALNTVVTSSAQNVNVANTAATFTSRALDSSFAAAYFPDVVMQDPFTLTNVQVPPSVAVLGAMSLNDKIAHPWFAPAGFTRGALQSTLETSLNLSRNNLDVLYDTRINPITSYPGQTGPVIWGQKTLLGVQSALDRVNVRRLLIEVRRQVKELSNRVIFEPNRASTLSRFEALVRPRLQRIQELQGVERYQVRIDTTTTTQADIENNTIRGKIFLQPTRSIEFVALDFVITNAGADI
jgi:phage tail sheath protein FI